MAYNRVLAAALLCYAALGAVLRVLPGHVTDLGAGPFAVGLAVGAPAITGLFARPGAGRLADRLGPRAILPAGAAIMAAGMAPAVVDDVPAQVAARLVVGAGEALMMSAAVLWLLRLAGPERRGRALGHIGLASYGGLAAGPLLADVAGGFESVLLVAAVLPLVGAAVMPRATPPDAARERDGATLAVAAPLAAVGLCLVALVPGLVVPGVVALGAGQAFAVPALSLLALARIPPARHGAAAGLFFSWFDAGVGLGGPAAGFLAHLSGPSGALLGAAIAVACTAPIALVSTIRPDADALVN